MDIEPTWKRVRDELADLMDPKIGHRGQAKAAANVLLDNAELVVRLIGEACATDLPSAFKRRAI